MKAKTKKNEGTEYISKDVVRMLRNKHGWTLKEIGEAIECGEAFVSMVGSGKRSFTLDHLTMIEKRLGTPVAMLLLESIDPKKVNKQLKPLYNQFVSLVTGNAVVKSREKRKAKKNTKQQARLKRVAV